MSKIIIVTGAHQVLSSNFVTDKAPLAKIEYYPSISDGLMQQDVSGHWRTCPFFDDLVMQREMARDSAILESLRRTPTVLIAQWHVGNLAWANVRSSYIRLEYTAKLRDLLALFKDVVIESWYVSTDLDKVIFGDFRDSYQMYLQQVSAILESLSLRTENIDGDAPPDALAKRMAFLLSPK